MLTNKAGNKTFFATERTGHKEHYCGECGKTMNKGDKVLSVIKTDGFNRIFVGYICDETCFKKMK